MVEDADALPRALPLLPPYNCRLSGWMGDFRPSLAMDLAGTASIAFDNDFWVTCSDYTSTRTMFAGVRLVKDEQVQPAAFAQRSPSSTPLPSASRRPRDKWPPKAAKHGGTGRPLRLADVDARGRLVHQESR